MFKAKDEITNAVSNVFTLVQKYARGEVIPWYMIETAAGFERYTTHWSSFIKRLKDRVGEELGIVLWAVKGVGLEVMNNDRHIHDRSISRQRRATKQLHKDIKELKYLPDKNLTEHQREAKRRKIDRAKHARNSVLYSLKVGHILRKEKEDQKPPQRKKRTSGHTVVES